MGGSTNVFKISQFAFKIEVFKLKYIGPAYILLYFQMMINQ